MKSNKLQKIFKNPRLLISLPALVLIFLLIFSFIQATASYRHYPRQDSWTQFDINNSKRSFNEFFQNILIQLKKLTIDNKTIINKFKQNKIDYFSIKTSVTNLTQLNSNLPESGQQYTDGYLTKLNQKDQQKIRFKYRGDNFYHWGYTKKSTKIKFEDGRVINLVNPKEIDFIADKIAFDLAKDLKLYTPETKFTGLFINNNFEGIFLETQEVDSLFAKQQIPPFTAIFQGENIGTSNKSGLKLFEDPYKWEITGGYSSPLTIKPFLLAINDSDFNQLYQHIDLDYWAKFYAYVSIIQNSHYDDIHNWFLGFRNNKLYPIVWDPVGWVMAYETGNGIEEMKSRLPQTLRQNAYFNQKFIETIWSITNNQKTLDQINQNIIKQQEKLVNILDYDLYKGGVFRNPKGIRAPQSTNEIQKEITKLQQTIKNRFEFINDSIEIESVQYYTDNTYLYLQYSGIAGATVNGKNNIEILNQGFFTPLPSSLNHLVSGRTTSSGPRPYAVICPTTYRLKTPSTLPPQINNKLTQKPIEVKKVASFKSTDCNIDFTQPQKVNTSNNNQRQNYSKIEINLPTVNPTEYFLPGKKIQDQVEIIFANQKYTKVEFKKRKFDQKINLDFKDSKYLGRQKFDLYPLNPEYQYLPTAITIARSHQLPANKVETVHVYTNDSYIAPYLLVEDSKNKSFFKTNGLTFDTDIYRLSGNNPTNESDWEKISTDPRVKNKDKYTLIQLLKNIDNPQRLYQLIDWDNFNDFQNYLQQTGNQFPQYFLYFDNTLGRFKFIPENHVLYQPNDSFITNDTLLSIINQVKTLPSTFNHPIFKPEPEAHSYTIHTGNYRIKKDIIIPTGLHITIQAGTTLRLDPKVSILSFSPIQAIGTSDLPIKIIKNKTKPFGTFAIIGTKTNKSTLEFVEVNGGSESFINHIYLSGQFSAYHADIDIKNSLFKNAQADDSLNIKYANTSITDSHFEENSADAIDLDFVTGLVNSNTFNNNGNDALDLSGSTVSITQNKITNSGDKCISIGENSQPQKVDDNLLDSSNIGIEVKDGSTVTITNNTIQNNNIGINAYQKKEFFGSAQLNSYRTVFKNNIIDTDYQNTFTGTKLKTDQSVIIIH